MDMAVLVALARAPGQECFVKVGVYIDGLNLYYGGLKRFEESASGWRWLDLRQLSERLLHRRFDWLERGALLERVVCCNCVHKRKPPPGGASTTKSVCGRPGGERLVRSP